MGRTRPRPAGQESARRDRAGSKWRWPFERPRRWLESWFTPRPLGKRGEDAAARFLRSKGYTIISRGQRDRNQGEIDLVAVDGRTVVFVEVKTRRSADQGHPAEAVNEQKQRRLTRLALSYLKRHDLLECAARFDVVAITWPAGRRRPHIEHIPHAFPAAGHGPMFG